VQEQLWRGKSTPTRHRCYDGREAAVAGLYRSNPCLSRHGDKSLMYMHIQKDALFGSR
jgi:hypothetical protein